MKKRVPLVEQGDKSECGIAVASMILQYFGLTTTLLDLEQRYGVPLRKVYPLSLPSG